MKLTKFKEKFKPNSEGRNLQEAINKLELDILDAKNAALTLDIGGYKIGVCSDAYSIEIKETTYYELASNIIYEALDLDKLVLAALNKRIGNWEARLMDKRIAYKQLIA